MRVVIQRVSSASVRVAGAEVARIGRGLLVLAGVMKGDQLDPDVIAVADKLAHLRVFADAAGKMNLALREVGGAILVVSQFTLAGNLSRGRRPEFLSAELPDRARPLIEALVARLRALGCEVAEGAFGAHMEVSLVNDGPVTLVLDTRGPSVAPPVSA